MKTYNHIIRFALLIILVIIGFLVVRTTMVPDSFGVQGSYTYAYYRADSKDEQASLPAIYQGTEQCNTCHASQAADLTDGTHSGLDCESCHGSFQAHNNNTANRMAISDPIDACMTCHTTLSARPSEFPQINSFEEHLKDQGETMLPGLTCSICHDPHMPM